MPAAVNLVTRAGVDELPPPEQRVVANFEHIASALGRPLDLTRPVLDFGAGAGRHVAEFRAAGYDAWGIDQSFASHAEGSVQARYLKPVSPPDYVLPFPDGHFGFVYSTSVMEHVLDPGQALAEIARVLAPDGLSIHVFPSRWRPREPHMYVPFGGRVQGYWAMRMWAALGIRNNWQQGLGASEVALRNTQYCKTGISYPTTTEWRLRASAHFAQVQWAERQFIEASASISRVSRAAVRWVHIPGMPWLYRGLHNRVLVLSHPR